ncbi:hypothetical protein [Niabella aquatica]
MKSKHPKDPFETQCWLYQPVTDPYQVIAGIFAEAQVHDFRKLVKKLVSHACNKSAYKGQPREDVLLYMKLIRSLIKAANALKHQKRCPAAIPKNDLFNKKYYCSHYVSANAWKEFPRHLSEKEYGNPYLVIKKFFRHQPPTRWLQCWKQVAKKLCAGIILLFQGR